MNKLLWIIILTFCIAGCSIWENEEQKPDLRIGVLLPYSGEYASGWDSALDWAKENINKAGGVAGCNIQLVKINSATGSLSDHAKKFLDDEKIKAVIGPLTSTEVFDIAPEFINKKKVLMSPVATASDISRAFAGKKYFWRLAEPDISQTKTLLLLAQSGGAHSVSLITEDSEYGASFEDWFGFFATELGLEVKGIKVITPDAVEEAGSALDEVIAGHPDAVVAAINSLAQNVAITRAYRNNGQQARLLFSDAANLPSLIDSLGSLAENLEGTTISSDPSSGFDISYKVRYGKYPEAFLSNMYDAVMLLSLALEASGGEGGEALADALKQVVSGRKGKYSWQRDELCTALGLVNEGIFPNISGASGSLDYDELYYTDVTSTTYGHWRVDAGQFVITDFYTSDGNGRISSTSAAYRTIANNRQQFLETGAWPVYPQKTGLYAFLMATSKGWDNYRHQADVLHTYQLLKANGVDDSHIILILADDLAGSEKNNLPGEIRNEPEGDNLYKNVIVDYKLSEIDSAAIKNILIGVATPQTPQVMPSSSTDNIFIFTSGHGLPEGIVLEGNKIDTLTPEFWQSVFENMNQKKNYRQVFWALESCYSGKIGKAINTPGVMLMTGANPYETSKALFYDSEQKAWLADKFAYSVNKSISQSPRLKFNELYERSYSYVNGSHVSFYNYQNFGNIYELALNDFIAP